MRVEHGAPAGMPGFIGGDGVDWISWRQKSPTKQKKLLHTFFDMVFWGFSLGHVFGRDRERVHDHSSRYHADAKARRVHQDVEA